MQGTLAGIASVYCSGGVYYGRLVVQRTRTGITAMTSMAVYNGWDVLQCAMLRIALYKIYGSRGLYYNPFYYRVLWLVLHHTKDWQQGL